MASSPSKKQALLLWVQDSTSFYPDIEIKDFTGPVWRNGLAFCALIHSRCPDLIPMQTLSKDNPSANLKCAFQAMQKLDIPIYVEEQDVTSLTTRDDKIMMTQIAEIYNKIRSRPHQLPHSLIGHSKLSPPLEHVDNTPSVASNGTAQKLVIRESPSMVSIEKEQPMTKVLVQAAQSGTAIEPPLPNPTQIVQTPSIPTPSTTITTKEATVVPSIPILPEPVQKMHQTNVQTSSIPTPSTTITTKEATVTPSILPEPVQKKDQTKSTKNVQTPSITTPSTTITKKEATSIPTLSEPGQKKDQTNVQTPSITTPPTTITTKESNVAPTSPIPPEITPSESKIQDTPSPSVSTPTKEPSLTPPIPPSSEVTTDEQIKAEFNKGWEGLQRDIKQLASNLRNGRVRQDEILLLNCLFFGICGLFCLVWPGLISFAFFGGTLLQKNVGAEASLIRAYSPLLLFIAIVNFAISKQPKSGSRLSGSEVAILSLGVHLISATVEWWTVLFCRECSAFPFLFSAITSSAFAVLHLIGLFIQNQDKEKSQ